MTTIGWTADSAAGDAPLGVAQAAPTGIMDPPAQTSGDVHAAPVASTTSAKIMIVDDEPFNIMVVRKYLQRVGYQAFCATSNPTEAMAVMERERPDLAILDVVMPELSGLQLLAAIRSNDRTRHVPVIILTASSDAETKLQALEAGATDFLAKPVDPSELALRVRNTLVVKAHQDYLESYSERLEREVRLRTTELEVSRREAIHCLARAAEYRDEQTGYHVVRVGMYAGIIARQLGIADERVEVIQLATQLHDVGKIGIADAILLKPGPLDPAEFELMKRHCEYGQTIIRPLADDQWSTLQEHTRMGKEIMSVCSSPIMQVASLVAQTHHERWDGTGYPQGLAGETIPIEGRIASVADVYDALTSPRPYKGPLPHEKCVEIMREGRGTQFDPAVLDAFVAREQDVLNVLREFGDKAT